MRLSERIRKTIVHAAKSSFGDVNIYLFGSRVHDNKIGGDIDIAVETSLSSEQFLHQKASFLATLMRAGMDIKIDVVMYSNSDSLLDTEIRNNHIKLT